MPLTFINSHGNSVVFSKIPPYKLIQIEGTGGLSSDVQMEKAPFQDGSSYIDTLLEPRSVSLEVGIYGNDATDLSAKRSEVSRVFNPKLGVGILRYEYDGGTKELNATVETAPVFLTGGDNSTSKFQRVLINLIAPLPFWLDIETTSEPMTAYLGLFQFPLTFPTQMGEQGDKQTFTNHGDVPTPVIIEFNGPATNPKVSNNTTGQYVRVNRTLATGEKLVIETTFGNKRVEIVSANGTTTNVFNWIDLNSTFFQLEVGENEIEYTADDGGDGAIVAVTWRNRYIGI